MDLSSQNYRIVKTNVVGTEWGISLFGLIPITSPDYVKAVSKLYEDTTEP